MGLRAEERHSPVGGAGGPGARVGGTAEEGPWPSSQPSFPPPKASLSPRSHTHLQNTLRSECSQRLSALPVHPEPRGVTLFGNRVSAGTTKQRSQWMRVDPTPQDWWAESRRGPTGRRRCRDPGTGGIQLQAKECRGRPGPDGS